MALYTCTKCNQDFPFGKIKYDTSMKIVCHDCLGEKEEEKSPMRRIQERASEDKVKLICSQCRFQFSLGMSSQQAWKCPNCDSSSLMRVKKYKDADDLINESMDPRFDA